MEDRKYLFTIRELHLKAPVAGQDSVSHQANMARAVIGTLLPCDVNKKVYRVGKRVYVENSQQRDARLGLTGPVNIPLDISLGEVGEITAVFIDGEPVPDDYLEAINIMVNGACDAEDTLPEWELDEHARDRGDQT